MSTETNDKRKNYPTVSGNFVIAGDPKLVHIDAKGSYSDFYILNFSLFWKPMIRGKDFDKIEPSFMDAFIIVNPEVLEEVKESIQRKSRIHIVEGIPILQTWESKKDGTKRSKIAVRVYQFYPYWLDKELNPVVSKSKDDSPVKEKKLYKTEEDKNEEYQDVVDDEDVEEVATTTESTEEEQDIDEYI